MRVFWLWAGLSLVGWVLTPFLGMCLPAPSGWFMVGWAIAVPFLSYRRAVIMVRRAEAREVERMAQAVAEGMRRAARPQ